jgi:hypothetical protein
MEGYFRGQFFGKSGLIIHNLRDSHGDLFARLSLKKSGFRGSLDLYIVCENSIKMFDEIRLRTSLPFRALCLLRPLM